MNNAIKFSLVIMVFSLMAACGGGGGGNDSGTTDPAAKRSLSVVQSADKTYTVQAQNLGGVAGINITIFYNATSLSTPSVIQGGAITGALLSPPNINDPGIIRIAAVNATGFTGSGTTVLQINFGTRNGTGGITSVSCEMIDVKGGNIPCQASL